MWGVISIIKIELPIIKSIVFGNKEGNTPESCEETEFKNYIKDKINNSTVIITEIDNKLNIRGHIVNADRHTRMGVFEETIICDINYIIHVRDYIKDYIIVGSKIKMSDCKFKMQAEMVLNFTLEHSIECRETSEENWELEVNGELEVNFNASLEKPLKREDSKCRLEINNLEYEIAQGDFYNAFNVKVSLGNKYKSLFNLARVMEEIQAITLIYFKMDRTAFGLFIKDGDRKSYLCEVHTKPLVKHLDKESQKSMLHEHRAGVYDVESFIHTVNRFDIKSIRNNYYTKLAEIYSDNLDALTDGHKTYNISKMVSILENLANNYSETAKLVTESKINRYTKKIIVRNQEVDGFALIKSNKKKNFDRVAKGIKFVVLNEYIKQLKKAVGEHKEWFNSVDLLMISELRNKEWHIEELYGKSITISRYRDIFKILYYMIHTLTYLISGCSKSSEISVLLECGINSLNTGLKIYDNFSVHIPRKYLCGVDGEESNKGILIQLGSIEKPIDIIVDTSDSGLCNGNIEKDGEIEMYGDLWEKETDDNHVYLKIHKMSNK